MPQVVMDVDELYHHGILGQKWGVRRTEAQLGNFISRSTKKASSAIKKYDSSQKEDARLRIKNSHGNKGAAIAKEAAYGGARKIGVALGSGTINALSAVALAKGKVGAAKALSSIGSVAYTSASIANAAYTGKNIAYLALSKK